jgi:hypothetical protein
MTAQALLAAWSEKRWVRWSAHLLRWLIPIVLLGFVGWRLTELGWAEIWQARPSSLVFYLMLVAQFFIQPLGDLLIYRNLWRPHAPPFAVILRKRFLNSAIFDYTGEVFFFLWAQKTLNLPRRMIVHAIKDSNVLSAGAALTMVWLIALALLLLGGLRIPQMFESHGWFYALVGCLPFFLCATLFFAHRRVTVLSRRQIAQTFGIHFLRCLLVLTVEFGLWVASGALPTAIACLQYVALRLVVTRLPFVPNKDLVYVGVGIAAAGMANVAVTPVATVLVIIAAADMILACTVAGVPWAFDYFFGAGRRSRADA